MKIDAICPGSGTLSPILHGKRTCLLCWKETLVIDGKAVQHLA